MICHIEPILTRSYSIMKKALKNNILIINPWIYDFAAFDLWAKPLGLLYLASTLRKNGYNLHYLDCLDIHNREMLRVAGYSPKRKMYGTGQFYKQSVKKLPILKNIPRKFSRYGITTEIFCRELKRVSPPQAILVTSMMTYWYPGVFEVIKIVKNFFTQAPVILGGVYASLCYEHAAKTAGADFVITGEGETKVLELLKDLTGQKTIYFPDSNDLNSYPYPAFDLLSRLDYIPILTSRG